MRELSHSQAIQQLLERINQLRNGDCSGPQMIVLEGASGTGKTWIVQQLYSKLREEQGANSYWPDLFDPGADFLRARKLLAPSLNDFYWRANVLPKYGWWAFNCAQLEDGSFFQLSDMLKHQLVAHKPALGAALKNDKGALQSFCAEAKRFGVDLLKEEGMDALQDLLGLPPFMGLGVQAGKQIMDASKERRTQKTDQKVGFDSGAIDQMVQSMVESIEEIATKDVPAIVAIEDLHLMPEVFGKFLDRLLFKEEKTQDEKPIRKPKKAPVLIVATAWKERISGGPYSRWSLRTPSEVKEIWAIGSPGKAALESVVERSLRLFANRKSSGLTQREKEALSRFASEAEILQNPLNLQLWLGTDDVQYSIGRNYAELTYDKRLLPREGDVARWFEQRWYQLPPATRRVLKYAAVARFGKDTSHGPFSRNIIEDLLSHNPALSLDLPELDVISALDEACDSAGWCLREATSQRYAEPALWETAKAIAEREVGPVVGGDVRAVVQFLIETWMRKKENWGADSEVSDGGISDSEFLTISRAYVELRRDDIERLLDDDCSTIENADLLSVAAWRMACNALLSKNSAMALKLSRVVRVLCFSGEGREEVELKAAAMEIASMLENRAVPAIEFVDNEVGKLIESKSFDGDERRKVLAQIAEYLIEFDGRARFVGKKLCERLIEETRGLLHPEVYFSFPWLPSVETATWKFYENQVIRSMKKVEKADPEDKPAAIAAVRNARRELVKLPSWYNFTDYSQNLVTYLGSCEEELDSDDPELVDAYITYAEFFEEFDPEPALRAYKKAQPYSNQSLPVKRLQAEIEMMKFFDCDELRSSFEFALHFFSQCGVELEDPISTDPEPVWEFEEPYVENGQLHVTEPYEAWLWHKENGTLESFKSEVRKWRDQDEHWKKRHEPVDSEAILSKLNLQI